MIEELHFLRPLWLLALVPAAGLIALLWRAGDAAQPWKRWIAPHLLPHLLGAQSRRERVRPLMLLGPMWLLWILALAGPSWEREPSPFVDETTALVVALRCGPEMLAADVQPSRLERAAQKIGDLVERRPGALTGLIAYAGSAHMVMPLTSDGDVIRTMADELSPEIMPRPEGDAAAAAVERALELLAGSGRRGSVLLVTGALPLDQAERIAELRADSNVPVHLFAVAAPPEAEVRPGGPPAPPLDTAALEGARRLCGGALVTVTPDERDLERLERAVGSKVALVRRAGEAAEEERWRDAGYWLLPALLLLSLAWSRPGWAARWPVVVAPKEPTR